MRIERISPSKCKIEIRTAFCLAKLLLCSSVETLYTKPNDSKVLYPAKISIFTYWVILNICQWNFDFTTNTLISIKTAFILVWDFTQTALRNFFGLFFLRYSEMDLNFTESSKLRNLNGDNDGTNKSSESMNNAF